MTHRTDGGNGGSMDADELAQLDTLPKAIEHVKLLDEWLQNALGRERELRDRIEQMRAKP